MIGVPLHGLSGSYQFRNCLDDVLGYMVKKGFKLQATYVPSSLLPANRNTIVRKGLEVGAKYIMMFDGDQTFQPDIIELLMEHRKPVVSALYFVKTPPFRPLMLRRVNHEYVPVIHWEDGELVSVDAMGGGGLLIETSVFNRIPAPAFACPPTFLRYNGARRKYEIDKEIRKQGIDKVLGEDVWFAHLCEECEVEMFVDTNVVMGHIGDHIYTDAEFRMAYEDGMFKELEDKYGELLKSARVNSN